MLARKKRSLPSKGNSSLRDDPPTSSYLSPPAKKGISLSSSSSSPVMMGVSMKREEKETGVRRPPSVGVTRERPIEQSDVLGQMIPKMKSSLFSADVNNAQKTKELRRLLNCLNEWGSINDQVMLKLVENLKENVDALDEKMTTLVHQILESDWCSRPVKVVKAMEDFISELLVIRPFYAGPVLQSLIKKFLPQSVGDPQKPDEIIISDQKVFDVAHRNLAKLLEAFPRMKESCIKTMGALYPYMGKSPYMHYCYVKNLVATISYPTISYAPQITCQIIHLCVHKLCRIDVNVPRHHSELMGEVINEGVTMEQVKSENGDYISVTLDADQVINSLLKNSAIQINPLVNVLDLCLSLVFECVESILHDFYSDDPDSFYEYMLSTFETEVLPTFGVNHVQFLYFYLVSSQPSFTQKFLEFLWKRGTNVNTAPIIRMQCMAYIAGVLARSTVVSVKILKRWLSKMAEWANLYVDQRVKNSHWSSVNIQVHGPFYAVCQTIFYVFAFRNKDLIGSRKCTAFTGTLNLGRLVTCDLNPLKAVIPPVAVAFVKAAHTHQISYCQTVLDRNQRATIPTCVRDSLSISAMDGLSSVTDTLEAFFPFDPFHLPRSKRWIDSTYRIYEPYLPEVKIEKAEGRKRFPSRSGPHNEDSIDMELSTSFKDRDCSHFMAGLMDSSDAREDELMDE